MDGNTTTSRLQPALVGGLVAGVLSALPFISTFNFCCCLWVVTGGVIAAYLLQERQAAPLQVGDGALVGLMAGLIGAFVNLVLSIPITILMAPMMSAFLERLIEEFNLPPEAREMATSGVGTVASIVMNFVFALVAGVVFSTLGGMLGATLFRKSPPPAVIDIPPPEI